MLDTPDKYREVLMAVARLAEEAMNGDAANPGAAPGGEPPSCVPHALPDRLRAPAAATAVKINPMNAAFLGANTGALADLPLEPAHLTLMTSKYWGRTPRQLTVSFMESTPADLRNRILGHMNAWNQSCGFSFVFTAGNGQVRISRGGGGYWSYLGTDILHVPANHQTMNLQGFTMNTPDSEYKRVVRHETGHTMGFPHEHMRRELISRIDPQKAYDYFLRTQGWNRQMVDQQVLTPLDQASIIGTPADQTSIMCYQLPGSITRDGRPIAGGIDINPTDAAFAGQIYPRPAHIGVSGARMPAVNGDWGEDEDVNVDVDADASC